MGIELAESSFIRCIEQENYQKDNGLNSDIVPILPCVPRAEQQDCRRCLLQDHSSLGTPPVQLTKPSGR